jgi:sugar lactone lactonase YvrE
MKKSHLLICAVAGVATLCGARFAAAQDDLYVSDTGNGSTGDSLTIIQPGGAMDVITNSTYLDDPTGLAFNSAGNLFIANSGNGTISEYDPTTNTFSSFSSGLTNPQGLLFDSSGNLYVANDSSGPSGGITEYKGGSALPINTIAYASPLNSPSGITIDGFGDLFVTVANDEIAEIAPGGGAASTHLFTVPGLPLNSPDGITFGPSGDLYIVNTGGPTVEQVPFSLSGNSILISVGSVGQGLSSPRGLTFDNTDAFDSHEDLYVADYGNNTVTQYQEVPDSNGVYELTGSYTTDLNGPSFLTFGPAADLPVPEPTTYALLLAGAGALYFFQRRRAALPVKA